MRENKVECRTCGTLFVPCNKSSAELGAFNWREVACCEECGQTYLSKVLESRSPVSISKPKTKVEKRTPPTVKQTEEELTEK